MPTWLIVTGSPRRDGRSARVARMLEAEIAAKHPEVSVERFDISRSSLEPCDGCELCAKTFECIHDDDATALIERLLEAERVFVVAPIYFASVPSQFKAALDRMQPLFHKRMDLKRRGLPLPLKHPLHLYLVGDGGDPHGYEGAVVSVRSAFALADLCLASVHPLMGFATEADERTAVADVFACDLRLFSEGSQSEAPGPVEPTAAKE